MVAQSFAEMTEAALVDAGAAVANLKLHPGWPVLMDLFGRLEQQVLEVAIDDAPENLPRHAGERAALRDLRRLLEALPTQARELLGERVEDGLADEEELANFLQAGGGDLS